MHEPIRDNLEEHLRGQVGKTPQEFKTHLAACQDCATELSVLEAQARMLRTLQHGGEIEPPAGFYARVMERIEQQGGSSIWSILLEPAFGRRLAIASAALVVLLGTYLVTAEMSEPEVVSAPASAPAIVAIETPAPEAPVQADSQQQQQRRDAVLVNLASFRQ